MKKLITVILLAVFFSTAFAEVKTYYYNSGQKEQEVNYKDGKKHGLETGWHKNGQKSSETNYNDGKEHGLLTWWHKNGQKWKEANYKDGKLHGLITLWREKGQKKFGLCYQNDKTVDDLSICTGKPQEKYPSVNECVTISTEANNIYRYFENKCNFDVYVNWCDIGRDCDIATQHLTHHSPLGGYEKLSSSSQHKYEITYFACREHQNINNNKIGETKFSCSNNY